MSTIAQYQIHVTREKDGLDCGFWKSSGGWKRTAPSATSREQYGEGRRQHGGQATHEAVNAKRTNYPGDPLTGIMDAGVGRDRYILNRQKLDADGFAVGAPKIRVGVLTSFELADVDVDGEGVDEYTAEWEIEG
ncbi:MAG: hypothetical protein JWM93_865 [Frankiales bacterium]|nr:hypothetical protein [Frankiales bacterium]